MLDNGWSHIFIKGKSKLGNGLEFNFPPEHLEYVYERCMVKSSKEKLSNPLVLLHLNVGKHFSVS